jgi:hypothetical protein
MFEKNMLVRISKCGRQGNIAGEWRMTSLSYLLKVAIVLRNLFSMFVSTTQPPLSDVTLSISI